MRAALSRIRVGGLPRESYLAVWKSFLPELLQSNSPISYRNVAILPVLSGMAYFGEMDFILYPPQHQATGNSNSNQN
jgi:hypothetical protein